MTKFLSYFKVIKLLIAPKCYRQDNTFVLTKHLSFCSNNFFIYCRNGNFRKQTFGKMIFLLIIVAIALLVIYKYLAKDHDFFKKAGIKAMQPFFLLGNTGSLLFKGKGMGQGILWLYNAFPNEK